MEVEEGKGVRAYIYSRGSLRVLEQRKVPHTKEWVDVGGVEGAWKVIRDMTVRGAPLIAIVACLGLAVELVKQDGKRDLAALRTFLRESTARLRTARPTAVNLFNAMDELDAMVDGAGADATAAGLADRVVRYGEALAQSETEACRRMGEYGADAIVGRLPELRDKATVVTICNTGSLATAGVGTALGVARTLHARGRLQQLYVMETRPYNQGARLTAFEAMEDGLPATLITDSMVGALMRGTAVDACIVGADRIANNGDTANKIGTYTLAVVAHRHDVPFYVVAPTTTIDRKLPSGDGIVIEERAPDELRKLQGHPIAPADMPVWNPAFDVTPRADISGGIVTERGVIDCQADNTTMAAFLDEEV
eukprot:CAMPEP_0119123616 /NCGR_PEP_ID=MMETSP1310-20130426/3502_1 /TAXON_ID=464262 /ORGANISM="Genus nov. species nov., Strain RCC2339" /LENGTH=365 /DNA_ID=CAMNT_0007113459 /DNA_START=33 /DNA_END=1130 /DNA_ORIENTATION=+